MNEGDVVLGKIVHIADFGVFLEIKPGVEGLIHVSEIDREVSKKSLTTFYPLGSEIQAKVINLKASERRLGLSVMGLSEANYRQLQEKGEIIIGEDVDESTDDQEATSEASVEPTAEAAGEATEDTPPETLPVEPEVIEAPPTEEADAAPAEVAASETADAEPVEGNVEESSPDPEPVESEVAEATDEESSADEPESTAEAVEETAEESAEIKDAE